jgi:hypothetical protein
MRRFFFLFEQVFSIALALDVAAGCGGQAASNGKGSPDDAGILDVSASNGNGSPDDAGVLDAAAIHLVSGGEAGLGAGDGSCALPSSSIAGFDETCVSDDDCFTAIIGNICAGDCSAVGLNRNEENAFGQLRAATLPIGSGMDNECGASVPPRCCHQGLCTISFADCPMVEAGPPQNANDASYNPDYTVLCVEDAGAIDSGVAVPGVSRRCNGPEQCLQFNGDWQCCVTNLGPIEMCIAP